MTEQESVFRWGKARLWAASIAAAGLVAAVLFPTDRASAAETGPLAAGWDCSSGYVALTYDDGPDVFNDRTSQILDTLRDYGVHATFFVLGERVADPNQPTRPDLVRREASEGHTVANHTWDHPDLTRISASDVQWQLSRANDVITAAGAPRPTFFRPPYGYSNSTVVAVSESLGLRQVLWDVNKSDAVATSPSAVADPILAAVRPGSVVVMHDWAPHTANALPMILDGLKSRRLCPGLLAPTTDYNAQVRSYVAVVPDPNGPNGSSPQQCPCSIFSPLQSPAIVANAATGPHELGVRFAADVPGRITAIRFYKASVNTGPHPVRLWSSGGTLLGSGTALSESSSGWQQVDIPGGVQVQAGTPYVASYSAPAGRFSQDVNFFTTSAGSSPIRGLASTAGAPNGLYATATGAFPTRSYSASNYWVDVVFVPDSTGTPVPAAAVDDVGSTPYEAALSVAAPGVLANDSGTGLSVTAWSQPSHGSVSMTATGGYTYTPAAGFSGTDSFTYTITGTSGSTASATVRVSVSAPSTVIARDTFTRSITGGWGSADLGGAWTPNNSLLSVDGQRGVFAMTAGRTRQVFLRSMSTTDSDTTASVRLDTAPGGSGAYASLVSRRVAESVEYRGTARVQANGSVSALIYRMNGTLPETVIGTEVVIPGLSAAPGSSISLRLRTTGTNPTRLSLAVWQTGSAEPAPQVTASDSTAALQSAGAPGITAALSSRHGSSVVRFSFDDFIVRR